MLELQGKWKKKSCQAIVSLKKPKVLRALRGRITYITYTNINVGAVCCGLKNFPTAHSKLNLVEMLTDLKTPN